MLYIYIDIDKDFDINSDIDIGIDLFLAILVIEWLGEVLVLIDIYRVTLDSNHNSCNIDLLFKQNRDKERGIAILSKWVQMTNNSLYSLLEELSCLEPARTITSPH